MSGSLADSLERRVLRFEKVAAAVDAARNQFAYRESVEASLHALGIGQPQIAADDYFAAELAADRHHFVDALRALAAALGDATLARVFGRFLRGVEATPALLRVLRRYVDEQQRCHADVARDTAKLAAVAERLFTALEQTPLARTLAALQLQK